MRKRNALIGLAIVVVAGGWYAFRPERLFVNQTVNESLGSVSAPADPAMAPSTNPPTQTHTSDQTENHALMLQPFRQFNLTFTCQHDGPRLA